MRCSESILRHTEKWDAYIKSRRGRESSIDAHGFYGITFHDLRHSHASYLLANCIDAQAVSTRLGHADASTTLCLYAHAM